LVIIRADRELRFRCRNRKEPVPSTYVLVPFRRIREESMARFPDEVLTRTKKGEIEVRSLVDRGRYIRYRYLHPETGEPMEGGKVKLVLQADTGRTEEYFLIPTKSKRDLLIPTTEKGDRKVWDGTRSVDL
jgi:hypothetical protein